MDAIDVAQSIYDITDSDLKELWANSDAFEDTSDMNSGGGEWLLGEASPILFQDRMMSDTVQCEHSYSNQSSQEMVLPHIKLEEEDMESECFPAVPVSTATGQGEQFCIKEEAVSPPSSPHPTGRIMSASALKVGSSRKSRSLSMTSSTSTSSTSSLLKSQAVNINQICPLGGAANHTIEPVRVKVEPGLNCLPPSPPSSVSNDSESDVCLSPSHPSSSSSASTSSASTHPQHQQGSSTSSSHSKCKKTTSSTSITSQLISSQSNSRSGVLYLTEEEKRTLVAEGYPVPSRLPLTKAEERSLKKIRRKIKNKISAQESRRKKKEYMDALEKKVENLAAENKEIKRRYDMLEQTNRSLVEQLRLLQQNIEGNTMEENVDEIINITDVAEDITA